MAIPTILRGDDSGSITISLDTSHTFTGATLAFAYQGVTRTFSNLTGGGTVSLAFTHDETSGMKSGCYPVLMELLKANGERETVSNAEMRIKVTDCVSEVNTGSSFAIAPTGKVSVTELGDLGERHTMADIAAKVNQIVRVLAQRSLQVLAFAALAAYGDVEIQTCIVSNLYNDARVVTNLTGDIASKDYVQQQITSAGSVTEDGVRNIVTNDTVESSTFVGSHFVCPVTYDWSSGSEAYSITNLAVRWNGSYWEMHVAGWSDGPKHHDGWYKCATTNWNDGNPYCTVNSNLNTDAVTVWIGDKTETGFSQNIGDGLRAYADGTEAYTVTNGIHNTLGLAYERDIPTIASNTVTKTVPAWALAETPPESMTGNALVLTNETVKTKDGTTITASHVGAVSHNGKIQWVGDNLAISAIVNADTIDCSHGVRYQSENVVYGISTNGTDYLHANVNLKPIADDARSALAYSSGVYQYMNANTNAWFEGTNYNVNAEQAAAKTKYSPESWEDVATTPCSLQLYEIRDGSRQKVWDQRDWTVYYWNFKSAQMSNALASATSALSRNVESNCMSRGWSKYTAVNGLDNPNPSTLFVDTEKVSLMAGMQWEKMFELSGHAYYTIAGNGITVSTNDQNSTFLSIKDFEGNACLTFRKTSSYLVYLECGSEITNSFIDASGNVCFRMTTDLQPTAEFSTTLDDEDFVEQGESGCPADYEWTGAAGNWVCHFLLKSGIESTTCFARFKILREGENVVEHTVPIKLDGGIVFTQGGIQYKIKPSVSGSTVTWNIVQ